MISQAVKELNHGLLNLNNISYDSIDRLMRKIMKSHDITAKELHNAFKTKYKKTPDDWINEKMKNLKEDHKEIASGKKVDDEGYMARSELDSIEKAIKSLRKSIKSGDQQLPAWVQSKITKARDYIDTASEYLESDEKIEEEISPTINVKKHKKLRKKERIYKLTKSSNPYEANVAKSKLKGPSLPFKEEISLVEKILGEEKCGKGMYWCNTDKVCKPIPDGMKIDGQKVKPTEVGIGKPVSEGSCTHTKKGKSCPVHGMNQCPMSEEKDPKGPTQPYKSPEELAKKHGISLKQIQKQVEIGTKVEFEHTSDKNKSRITALQHLDELPDYYTKLKKMETQKESSIVGDATGNYYAESARIPAQTGNNVFVTLSWRGKYHTIQIFFPQSKVPSRIEISDEIQKIYPESRVITYRVTDIMQGEPLIYAYKGGNAGKFGPNKNYVKPMSEEVEICDKKR